jgi:hypothetical protein
MVGNIGAVFKPAGKFFDLFLPKGPGGKALTWAEKFSGIWAKIGSVGKLLKIGGALTIALTLIIRFIELIQLSQEFKDMLGQIGESISSAFDKLKTSLGELWDSIKVTFGIGQGEGGTDTGLSGILNGISDIVLYTIIPVFGYLATAIINSITLVTDLLGTLFNAFGPGINQLLQGVLDLFQGKFESGMTRIFGGIAILLLGIIQTFVNAFIDLMNFVGSNIEGMIKSFGSVPFVSDLLKGVGLDPTNFKLDRIKKVTWAEDASKNIDDQIKKMADGGTVYPRTGGTMVTVAEAGKPERIEPLDADGLSQRDKALIKGMSSTNSGVVVNMTVNATPGMDVQELTSEISRRLAFSLRKGSTAI